VKKSTLASAIVLALSAQAAQAETPSNEEMWQIIQQLKAENAALKASVADLKQDQDQTEAKVVSIATNVANGQSAAADSGDQVKVGVGGFIRADAGFGNRYGEAHEDDRIGISKAALAVTAEYKNVKGVFVVGTEVTSLNNADEDGNVDIKDAFVVLQDFGFDGFDLTLGAQPLLFGLKPNGYPGDHSIQGSIEYGAGGAFAVSNQAGPAIVGSWEYSEGNTLRFGVFDQKDYAGSPAAIANSDEGSTISDNAFIHWQGKDLYGSGIYASLGYESRYVGGMVNANRDIYEAGIGWSNDSLDLSVEYVSLDEAFNGTEDQERYLIVESAWQLNEDLKLYLDYSEAKELDIETYRAGVDYQYNKHTLLSLEYSQDDLVGRDQKSLDLRVALYY